MLTRYSRWPATVVQSRRWEEKAAVPCNPNGYGVGGGSAPCAAASALHSATCTYGLPGTGASQLPTPARHPLTLRTTTMSVPDLRLAGMQPGAPAPLSYACKWIGIAAFQSAMVVEHGSGRAAGMANVPTSSSP